MIDDGLSGFVVLSHYGERGRGEEDKTLFKTPHHIPVLLLPHYPPPAPTYYIEIPVAVPITTGGIITVS